MAGTLEPVEAEHSTADVLKGIVSNIQEIVRSEIQLAKVELTETGRAAGRAGMMLATGGVLAVFGLGFLLLCAMFALEMVVASWLAALIVGALLVICAAMGIGVGRARLKAIQPPRKTIQTVKETLEWIKEQPKS